MTHALMRPRRDQARSSTTVLRTVAALRSSHTRPEVASGHPLGESAPTNVFVNAYRAAADFPAQTGLDGERHMDTGCCTAGRVLRGSGAARDPSCSTRHGSEGSALESRGVPDLSV